MDSKPAPDIEGQGIVSDADLREAQLLARKQVKPFRLSKYFINHTGKTCAIGLLLPILCLVVIVVSRTFELSGTDTREYYILNDERTKLDDGRVSSRDQNPFLAEGQDMSSLAQLKQNPEMTINILMRGIRENEQIANLDDFDVKTTSNVLSPNVFAEHKKIEDEYFLLFNYSSFCKRDLTQFDCDGQPRECALPFSYLNHPALYGNTSSNGIICGRKPGNEPVSQEAFNAFLNSIYGDDPYNMRVFFDSNSTNSTRFGWAAKSSILIGTPLQGYNSSNDRSSDQADEFTDWARDTTDGVNNQTIDDPNVDVYALSSTLTNSEFNEIIISDLTLAAVAIILVFLVIWIHTTSFILAGMTIIQVVLSFPFAYFFYRFVFRQLYFSTLQILTIFLLLGIGADDVFVFTDAWKQAGVKLGEDVDLETRMAWTYRRSVRAMTVTSFTTAAAFFVTAISPLMPISTLGVWAATLVLLQFFLVITVYPCAVVTWYRFWRPRLFVRGFCKPDSPEELERELAVKWWQRILPKSIRSEPKVKPPGEYRTIERFFRGSWLSFLKKTHYILIVFAFLLVGFSVWRAMLLETPREAESFLPDSHPILVASNTLRDAFPRSDSALQLEVWAVWGVKGTDRSGLSRFEVSELGEPVYDDAFDFTRSAVQQRVLDACSFFGNQTDLIFNANQAIDPVDCWISDYYQWRGESFQNFDSQAELIQDLLTFANASERYAEHFNLQRIALNPNRTQVLFTEVGFVGSTDADAPESVMWPVYERWGELMDEFNAKSPSGGNEAFVTSGFPWIWAVTQQTLVSSMIQGLIIMVCVAMVTLIISTMNWIVALVATACITGVICNLLALINLVGWNLGTTESVSVIIGIGYSFDGIAHMATAYVESHHSTREDRIRDALTELAISVLFGALTTFFAALAMLPAVIVFFVKFAVLLIATVTLSVLWSLTLFPAFMLTFGPENEFGSLLTLLRNIKCFGNRKGKGGKEASMDLYMEPGKVLDKKSSSELPSDVAAV